MRNEKDYQCSQCCDAGGESAPDWASPVKREAEALMLHPELISPQQMEANRQDQIRDVLIWSGGTGSGLPLIIEKGEALWAIAFLMGEKGQSSGAQPHMKFIFNLYELWIRFCGEKNCIYITLLTSVTCFMCAVFFLFHYILQQKSFIFISLLMHTESIQCIREWTKAFVPKHICIHIYSALNTKKTYMYDWYIHLYMYSLWIILCIIYVCCHMATVQGYTHTHTCSLCVCTCVSSIIVAHPCWIMQVDGGNWNLLPAGSIYGGEC